MRKFLIIFITITTLGLSLLIMLSAPFLKKPMGENDDIEKYIGSISESVKGEQWEKAWEDTEKLDRAWKIVVKRVQFSAERDAIMGLTINIARIKGGVISKDKGGTLSEISEAYEHWAEIGR